MTRVAAQLVVSLLLAACATSGDVDRRTADLSVRLAGVEERAARCAPRDLAYAHAAIDGARRASELGDGAAAARSLEEASRLTAAVTDAKRLAACPTPAVAPPPPRADGDGDGVPDAEDQCLAEREDRDGWLDHDGCPDPDNDGDGIGDQVDQCPNEPEDVDGVDDIDGCPEDDQR